MGKKNRWERKGFTPLALAMKRSWGFRRGHIISGRTLTPSETQRWEKSKKAVIGQNSDNTRKGEKTGVANSFIFPEGEKRTSGRAPTVRGAQAWTGRQEKLSEEVVTDTRGGGKFLSEASRILRS